LMGNIFASGPQRNGLRLGREAAVPARQLQAEVLAGPAGGVRRIHPAVAGGAARQGTLRRPHGGDRHRAGGGLRARGLQRESSLNNHRQWLSRSRIVLFGHLGLLHKGTATSASVPCQCGTHTQSSASNSGLHECRCSQPCAAHRGFLTTSPP